jgi:hypothetical protein
VWSKSNQNNSRPLSPEETAQLARALKELANPVPPDKRSGPAASRAGALYVDNLSASIPPYSAVGDILANLAKPPALAGVTSVAEGDRRGELQLTPVIKDALPRKTKKGSDTASINQLVNLPVAEKANAFIHEPPQLSGFSLRLRLEKSLPARIYNPLKDLRRFALFAFRNFFDFLFQLRVDPGSDYDFSHISLTSLTTSTDGLYQIALTASTTIL